MDIQVPKTTFKAQEYIFKQGDTAECAYIIDSGMVEVLIDNDGNEIVIATFGKGDILGEQSLIDHLPRTATARAIETTEVTEIPFDYLAKKIKDSDPAIRMLLRLVMARYRDINTRLETVAASLASTTDMHQSVDKSSMSMALKNVSTMYKNLQDTIDPDPTSPLIIDSQPTVSEGTMEFAKVMVVEDKMLRKAVDHEEFVMHYQPIIELSRNRIVGCEALIRWNHPSGELVLPALFLSQLEKNNLIVDLGYWIAEQACRFQYRIYEQFKCKFSMAINLSGKQFADQNLILKLADIIERTGARRNQIEFEVTESILIDDPEDISRSLHELKETGVGLAIDDFGTGYSSFSNLQSLPFDKLKIDRAFVSAMTLGDKSKQIVNSMINMSHELGMTVVAEGIEDKTELDILSEFNANYGQGFYFSKPLSEKDFLKLLQPKSVVRSDLD
jgi:diguanylate cyclase